MRQNVVNNESRYIMFRIEFREEEHVLHDWMRRRSCVAVLARPDHYVFGGARSTEDITPLLRHAARQLRPTAHHPSTPEPAR